MTFRQFTLLILAAASFSMLVACGSSSHPIAVTFAATPPTSVTAGSQTAITANVANDGKNLGVSWTVSCANSGQCGGFSSATTASGTPVTYTAPVSMPTGGVTITATSVTDSSKFIATGAITISGASGVADGNYVFQVSGQDVNSVVYQLSGVITVSGGVITAGEQDFTDFNFGPLFDPVDPTLSSIAASSDGNIVVTVGTDDVDVGVGGIETFNLAPLTATGGLPNSGLITEFDTFAAASGFFTPQDPTAAAAAPAGGYAFVTAGEDNSGLAFGIGGVINVDGVGTISGTGSVFDVNEGGTITLGEGVGASTVTGPDPFGRVVFDIVPSGATAEYLLAGYIANSSSVAVVETADPLGAVTGGTAFAQGTNTGTFSDTSTSIAGVTYTFGTWGFDASPYFTQFAGALTLNSDQSVSGSATYNDVNFQFDGSAAAAAGSWNVDAAGAGDVTIPGLVLTDTATSNTITLNLQLYVDGNGNATVLSVDAEDMVAGPGYSQTSGAAVAGAYAIDGIGVDGASPALPWSAVGQIAVDGSGNYTGFTDFNYLTVALDANSALTGTTASPVATLTGLNAITPAQADTFTLYVIDSNRAIEIENDNLQLGLLYGAFQN